MSKSKQKRKKFISKLKKRKYFQRKKLAGKANKGQAQAAVPQP